MSTQNRQNIPNYFVIGAIPLLVSFMVLMVSMFIFNLSSSLTTYLDAESYKALSLWYIFIALISFILLAFVLAAKQQSRSSVIVFQDPNKTWKDFASVIIGVFMGIGLVALLRYGLPFEQVIKVPEPILQFVVASTEELAFRLAIPAFLYLVFTRGRLLSSGIALIVAILIANSLFAMFHFASYQIMQDNARNWLASGVFLTPELQTYYTNLATASFESTIFSAFFFGVLQSVALFLATRLTNNNGEWAIFGVIAGHYIWNLYLLGISTGLGFNPWEYLFVFLFLIFITMFALGYFVRKKTLSGRRHYIQPVKMKSRKRRHH